MTPTKNDIKKWLKAIGKDREWLAKQCGVSSKRSIDNWFAESGKIPSSKYILVQKLMENESVPSEQKELLTLPGLEERGKMFLRLDEEAEKKVFAEAARLGMEVSAYCSSAVEWCCDQPDIGELLRAEIDAKKNHQDSESGINFQEFRSPYVIGEGPRSRKRREETDPAWDDC